MIYLICPNVKYHINRAPGNPSNDWLCGWEGCRARLHYSPVYMFVYQKAPMQDAIYAPGGSHVSGFHQQQYTNLFSAQHSDQAFQQQQQQLQQQAMMQQMMQQQAMQQQILRQNSPTPPIISPGIEIETEMEVETGHNNNTPQDFVEMTFGTPVIKEAHSQATLYQVLEKAGYLFLCRDGQFRKCKLGNQMTPDETVQEPGVVSGGYNGYCPHQYHPMMIVGRNEYDQARRFGAGQISYPDYVVQRSNITYSIELKTPRDRSFKKYLSDHFYIEQIFDRSIVDELEIRRRLTQQQVEICLLFDIRNIDNDDQVMIDLKNSIKSRTDRQNWWKRNIKCVIFYKRTGLTKRFTVDEILAGQQITNTTQQSNLTSFFQKKETK